MADLPQVEIDFLDPRFGVRFIGYPALGLVVLALVLAPYDGTSALGVLMMAVGYLLCGVGFVVTLLWFRWSHDERP